MKINWKRIHAKRDRVFWFTADGPDGISLQVEPVVNDRTGFPEPSLGWAWSVHRGGDGDSVHDDGVSRTALEAKAEAERSLSEILAELAGGPLS